MKIMKKVIQQKKNKILKILTWSTKKIVRDNENKTSYVKRRGRPRKNNDESKKQTIGSKRKGREYKVEDDDDNETKVKRKRNQKNNTRKIVDESSSKFEVTTTSSKALFNAMAILNVDRKKCLYEMGFGSLIGMEIHELPGMLEKCYNIHQDLISVREKLDEGLLRFPDCKKLNMFREKFEETTIGIDNDDTTSIDKESDSIDCQMESDSPARLMMTIKKECNEDVHHILNEDDNVDDSCPATGVYSVIEGDEVKLSEVEDVEKEKKQIGNEDDRVAIVQDSLERSEHTLEKEKKKISNEELRSQSLKGNVGTEVAVDSQHTIEDIFKQYEQIQSAEDVGCSIPDLDDAKLDIYNGRNLRSPYEDLIFESQSGLGLNHLEMETLTPTLMVSAYVIDVWAKLLNILEIYKDESLPLRYFFKITVYIPVYYIGKDTDDEKLAMFIKKIKESFNEDEKLMSLQNFKMRKVFVHYLYYVKYPKAKAIEKAKIKRMKMSWRTTCNSTDCGVFTMLHMVSYIGAEGEWKCGLAKESRKQNEQLNSLRSKFAAKIILSEFNLLREKFMKLVQAFEQKTKEERKKTIDDAIANRDHREEI
nr:hypothetical protein [Tanacetum cinerariifolium]